MPVEKSRLGSMEEIASGAEGTVYRLMAPPHLPGLSGALAYKEIRDTLPPPKRAAAIRAMERAVALRLAMGAADRAELDLYTTWPVETVLDRGATVGVLMPLIPQDFFIDTQPQGAPPARKVCEFAFLSADDTYKANMGIDLSHADDPLVRLALAAQLCYVIGLLHKHGIVYGDLSLKNAAIAVNPPRLLLLDCDPAAAVSDNGRTQLHSPFFRPPEIESGAQVLQDIPTDVYKLGLCILRSLVTGKGVTQLKDPHKLRGTLDSEGVNLVARAVSPVRRDRPEARQLCEYMVRTVIASARPPVIGFAELNRTVAPRGLDVVVRWSATGASRVRITGPNGLTIEVADPDGHPDGYTITPRHSGTIRIEASNRYGTISVIAGFLDVYDLPSFKMSEASLPRPSVAGLEPVQIPTALAALPARPLVDTVNHPVPRLEAPEVAAFLGSLRKTMPLNPLGAVAEGGTAAADAVRRAHSQANDQVTSLIAEALRSANAMAARWIETETTKVKTG